VVARTGRAVAPSGKVSNMHNTFWLGFVWGAGASAIALIVGVIVLLLVDDKRRGL
jgi:hypothetical protein